MIAQNSIPSWIRWLLLCAMLGLARPATADPEVSKEYQLKAAFLYNFTKFVDWPEAKFPATNSPIVIGVYGRNPFGSFLADAVKDRKVNGRSIEVKPISTLEEAKTVHVLFVAAAETSLLDGLADALKGGSVLGVGESEEFLQHGGMILFALDNDKVRFEINIAAAERAKLKISSQLQKLARAVRKKP